ATVKTIKHLLAKVDGDIKDEAFSASILELRNTPRADGVHQHKHSLDALFVHKSHAIGALSHP
ncbi:Uncharacterized protein FKW44_015721, partial [Caligus rogercresseyi]